MSNVNNYAFAEKLKDYYQKVIVPQQKKVDDGTAIMADPNHPWRDDEQKATGARQLEAYKAWLQYYQSFYDEGLRLATQHETLVAKMSKVYDNWYRDISNEGRQECEIMQSQADMLNALMGELYKELLPLGLEGMKAPTGMNL